MIQTLDHWLTDRYTDTHTPSLGYHLDEYWLVALMAFFKFRNLVVLTHLCPLPGYHLIVVSTVSVTYISVKLHLVKCTHPGNIPDQLKLFPWSLNMGPNKFKGSLSLHSSIACQTCFMAKSANREQLEGSVITIQEKLTVAIETKKANFCHPHSGYSQIVSYAYETKKSFHLYTSELFQPVKQLATMKWLSNETGQIRQSWH